MRGYLLDTNIISEYSRARPPAEAVRHWIDGQDESSLFLSVLTLGEIRKGIVLLPRTNRREQLEKWLALDLPARFKDRLLPVDAETAELWGTFAAEARLKGASAPIIDGLLAATARRHELTMVTRNTKDYEMWPVTLINPWDQSRAPNL
jgi:toxin FitB